MTGNKVRPTNVLPIEWLSAEEPVSTKERLEFERLILPHLGAAYGLARWLLRHPHDAEDAVQESVLKAYKAFHGYAGGNAQAWLLSIVRNTCLTMLQRRRADTKVIMLDDGRITGDRLVETVPDQTPLADVALISAEERRKVRLAIAHLPVQFREVLVLREYNDLSYREIADIVGAPVGTVMSRLARARERIVVALTEPTSKPGTRTTR
jgi:RNA polymerase sigma factor (sigma-70 family)